ncbi:MAG: cytochrome c [Nitrospirota bacterium]|nr:cytochrome c [Nitrospirota bacterium]
MQRFRALAVALAVLVGYWLTGTPGPAAAVENDPVKLGGDLVDHLGCLYCHGLGGRQGLDNPNAVRKYVPAWDEEAFVKKYPNPEGVRRVIQQGRFPEKDTQAKGNPIPMPPWGNRLTKEETEAIIAYIWSLRTTPANSHKKGGQGREVGGEGEDQRLLMADQIRNTQPPAEHTSRTPGNNPLVAQGQGLVEHLGCLHCHGLGGRQGMDNPNAVRKYVPSWDEDAFVRRYPVDDGVRWVITTGRAPERDPQAKGNPIPMPPWGNRLTKDELDAIVAYIWSLRTTPVSSHEKGGRGRQ